MLIVNLVGLGLVFLTIWWFWLYTPKTVKVKNEIVTVYVKDGVYDPAHISVPANRDVTIEFIRQDSSPCAETLIIPSLEISEALPLNQATRLVLSNLNPGHYPFHCQMKMYRGDIEVTRGTDEST